MKTPPREGRYAWYVVAVLTLCYTLSFIDRQILSLLVTPIKADLGISDTRMGLLQGLAFALFYTLMGLPMGRIADRASRKNLIALGVLFWSLMTALCASARSYASLFLARLGVGVGEATLGPGAMSLIADYVPRERLGTALSVYSLGIFVGAGLALIVGGSVVSAVSHVPEVTVPLLGSIASWRLTFLVVGLPGLVIGAWVFTLREPERRNAIRSGAGVARLGFAATWTQIRRRWAPVLGVSAGLSSQAMCNYAIQAWLPAYFMRVHGWTPARTGAALGVMILATGVLGMFVGGRLCDSWQRSGKTEAPLRVGVAATLPAGLFFALSMFAASPGITLALLAPAMFFLAMPVGSSYAALPLIFPNQLRGQVSAILLFSISLGGLTMGPLLTGLFTDRLFSDPARVGDSLALTVSLGSALAALLFRLTYASYRSDYAAMRREEARAVKA